MMDDSFLIITCMFDDQSAQWYIQVLDNGEAQSDVRFTRLLETSGLPREESQTDAQWLQDALIAAAEVL